MRICVLGAGGLGSVVGGYLAQSGVDVVLIGRAAHVDQIRQKGYVLRGAVGKCVSRKISEQ